MPASFPVLSVRPEAGDFSEGPAIDPTIASEMESGATVTRPRFTAVPKAWRMKFRDLTSSDKAALLALQTSVGYGAGIFAWTNSMDSVAYQVRFESPLTFVVSADNPMLWSLDMGLIEAYPNSGAQ